MTTETSPYTDSGITQALPATSQTEPNPANTPPETFQPQPHLDVDLSNQRKPDEPFLTGVVTAFKATQGFGFVKPNGPGDELFVHQSAIFAKGFRYLTPGLLTNTFTSEQADR